MAKKTWLFLFITTLLNIHNTIDGGAPRASPPLLHPPARSQLTIATRVSAALPFRGVYAVPLHPRALLRDGRREARP
jgi:hypothetical protein